METERYKFMATRITLGILSLVMAGGVWYFMGLDSILSISLFYIFFSLGVSALFIKRIFRVENLRRMLRGIRIHIIGLTLAYIVVTGVNYTDFGIIKLASYIYIFLAAIVILYAALVKEKKEED